MGFIVAGIFFVIAIIFYSIYLVRNRRARLLLQEAMLATEQGDHKLALALFKEALWSAREKADMEEEILGKIVQLYSTNEVDYDPDNYRRLIEQQRTLSKKGSQKALRGIKEVLSLKKDVLGKMPEI